MRHASIRDGVVRVSSRLQSLAQVPTLSCEVATAAAAERVTDAKAAQNLKGRVLTEAAGASDASRISES